MLWLALHFSQLQLDSMAGHRDDTALSARVIVDSKQHICQANDVALQSGLKLDMKLGTASALVENLSFVDFDPAFEQRRLQELANDCYAISADIVVLPEGTLLFEISSMLRFYGDFDVYWSCLQEVLGAQGVNYTQGVAGTAFAARLLACSALGLPSLAEQFSNLDAWREYVSELSIERLLLPARQCEQLRRLGFQRFSDLEALLCSPDSEKELGNRLGQELLQYFQRVLGRQATPLSFFKPLESFAQSLLLDYEIQQSQSLLFPLKNLLQRLQSFLQVRAQRVQKIHFVLAYRDGTDCRFELSSAEPERLAEAWLPLLQLKLERVELAAPVVALRLEAGKLLEEEGRATDLFDESSGLSPKSLLGRLQAKLGEQAIQGLACQQDHRPEYGFRYTRVASGEQSKDNEVADTSSIKSGKGVVPNPDARLTTLLRPNLLLEQPVPLSEPIRIIHGPERIQSAWWTDERICRDYFVARNPDSQTLWVFRDDQQQWFVHGLFA